MSAISVVMPTYNRASFIEEALDSLLGQTVPPLEVMVIDDGSSDDTDERVRRHRLGSRIRYLRNPSPQGASLARNLGVEHARGDIIVFLDSDDVLEPEHHARVLERLGQAPEIALVCCDCTVIGPRGERLHEGRSWTTVQCEIKRVRIGTGTRSLADIFLFSTPFPGLSVRREVYRRLGGLDQGIFPLDDYDLQLRVAAAGHGVLYEHRPLARYRVHDANESAGAGPAVRVAVRKLECLERTRGRYPALASLGARSRQRLGEVRREMAFALLREGRLGHGLGTLAKSLLEDPLDGLADLGRVAARKLASARSARW